MTIDDVPGALPTLVGAPAYARPRQAVDTAPRPFDPDELPLEIDQTEEERAFAARLPARAYAPGGAGVRAPEGAPQPTSQAVRAPDDPKSRSRGLRSITRLLGGP